MKLMPKYYNGSNNNSSSNNNNHKSHICRLFLHNKNPATSSENKDKQSNPLPNRCYVLDQRILNFSRIHADAGDYTGRNLDYKSKSAEQHVYVFQLWKQLND